MQVTTKGLKDVVWKGKEMVLLKKFPKYDETIKRRTFRKSSRLRSLSFDPLSLIGRLLLNFSTCVSFVK